MYKAIFFDIDDTLLNFELCSKQALKNACDILKIEFNDEVYNIFLKIDSKLWKLQKSEKLKVEEVIELRARKFLEALGTKQSHNIFKKVFTECLSQTSILESNVIETLKYLENKYKLYCASNGNLKTQLNRLKKAKINQYFQAIFVSDDIGYEKPKLEFFKECVDRCKIDTKNILMIGDSIESDIIGANNFGIDTCWYNKNNKISNEKSKYTIYDLAEIKQII